MKHFSPPAFSATKSPCTTVTALQIAFVSETFPPELNGVAMTAGRLVNGLHAAGHHVRIIRPQQRGESKAHVHCFQDIPTTLTHGMGVPGYDGIRFGLPCAKKLRQLWRQERPDVVHILTEGPLGHSAMRVAEELELPIVAGYHTHFDRYTEHYRFGLLRSTVQRYLQRFHNHCHVNLAPTCALVAELEAAGMENVRVLSRGVDKTLFSPTLRDERLRQQWGATAKDLVLLCVGRLATEKNLDLVAQAWLAVRQQQPSAKLVFVGAGPEKARLQHKYPQAIFTGTVSSQELGAHYASADVFVFASQSETFGNVVQEAMASGLAVVAYDYAAPLELIEHGENGLLVPFGDAQSFIQTTTELCQSPTLVRELGHAASLSGRTWKSVVHDLITAYRDAIAMTHTATLEEALDARTQFS